MSVRARKDFTLNQSSRHEQDRGRFSVLRDGGLHCVGAIHESPDNLPDTTAPDAFLFCEFAETPCRNAQRRRRAIRESPLRGGTDCHAALRLAMTDVLQGLILWSAHRDFSRALREYQRKDRGRYCVFLMQKPGAGLSLSLSQRLPLEGVAERSEFIRGQGGGSLAWQSAYRLTAMTICLCQIDRRQKAAALR